MAKKSKQVKKVKVEGYKPPKKLKTLKKGDNVDQVHNVMPVIEQDKKINPKKVFVY